MRGQLQVWPQKERNSSWRLRFSFHENRHNPRPEAHTVVPFTSGKRPSRGHGIGMAEFGKREEREPGTGISREVQGGGRMKIPSIVLSCLRFPSESPFSLSRSRSRLLRNTRLRHRDFVLRPPSLSPLPPRLSTPLPRFGRLPAAATSPFSGLRSSVALNLLRERDLFPCPTKKVHLIRSPRGRPTQSSSGRRTTQTPCPPPHPAGLMGRRGREAGRRPHTTPPAAATAAEAAAATAAPATTPRPATATTTAVTRAEAAPPRTAPRPRAPRARRCRGAR